MRIDKMRILFLTQRFPFPPDRGDRIRSYHILRHLARSHEVSLATLTDEDIQESHWKEINNLCASVDVGRIHRNQRKILSLFYLPTATPLTLPNYYSRELKAKVDLRLRKESFDLIFIFCSSMAPYVLAYDRIPKVIDFVDVDSEKWFEYGRSRHFPMNLVYLREGNLLRRYETRVAKSCRHAFVASHREKIAFEQFLKGTPITTIPNGVCIPENTRILRSGCKITFTGVMDYWPNEDAVCHFVHDIFPIIIRKIPAAEFVIVGQNPTRRVKELSKVRGITVTGWVSDPAKYLEESAVSVAPIRVARGIQNKVLEAMAYGVPVIATAAAADGMQAVKGKDFLLGDSPVEFAEQTILLLGDSKLREKIAKNAIGYLREKHNWELNMKGLENTLVNISGSTRETGSSALRSRYKS